MNRIAIVEDNEDNRMLLDAILEDLFSLEAFETGISAIESFLNNPPELVLMDISLPDMDGVEVLSKMREHASLEAIPVIALTAHAMVGDRDKYLNHGFDDYLAKPIVDELILIEKINSLLKV